VREEKQDDEGNFNQQEEQQKTSHASDGILLFHAVKEDWKHVSGNRENKHVNVYFFENAFGL